ncbi:hypothetical protein A1351_11350 [Methylosinus sp. R-45379]|uniref:hypothetical protein n=1 Tax=Methylosinus sp. R-45379 TaxID=980563 RepID=UPI0007C956FA|nr:hypothetical protein [Methylosinus sp. R-45379]OAI28692.1 hypothetical protein A1351_11350 [Methylosinus sp. R-45379]
MAHDLHLRAIRRRSGFAFDSANGAGASEAVGKIVGWAKDNLAPEEIATLIEGLRAAGEYANQAQDRRPLSLASVRNSAESFAARFPNGARIGIR